MTLKELFEKLTAKQDHLQKIFGESKQADGSYDFTKSATLNNSDPQKALEAVRTLNEELNDLGEEYKAAQETQQAADQLDADIKARKEPTGNRPQHQNGNGGKSDPGPTFGGKSVGQLVAEDENYSEFIKSGAPTGKGADCSIDLLPSDMFAKAGNFPTMGAKTLMQTTAGYTPESTRMPGFVDMAVRPLQLLDIIPVSPIGQPQVVYMEETTRNHAAVETGEGLTFAESEFAFTERTSPVRKITDSLPVTDEQLEDATFVSGYIDSRLTFGIRNRLDSQVLVGDGTGINLLGLANVAGIQTQAKGADDTPDAFYKAMTLVRLNGRAMPTHHVMHPLDWQGVRLMRTTDGLYIWGNPSEAGVERMWGLPVVQQDAGAAGTGWVGSFQPQWLSLFERRGVDIQVGYVDDQFKTGRRTVRGDMRAAFVVYRPAAFSEVTGL